MDEPNTSYKEEFFNSRPRIMLTGVTGAGKSSLINALLGQHVNDVDVITCTQKPNQNDWMYKEDSVLTVIDVPGFGEAGKHEERLKTIKELLPETHAVLHVVGAPGKAGDYDQDFARNVLNTPSLDEPAIPWILVGSGIDRIKPKKWPSGGEGLNLEHPSTEVELMIAHWWQSVQKSVPSRRSALVAAGEAFDDVEGHYGLEALKDQIYEMLPEICRANWARVSALEGRTLEAARYRIYGAAAAAMVAAATPIPFADAFIITTIQVAMVVELARLYGHNLTIRQGAATLAPVASAFAGPWILKQLWVLLPGLGSVAKAVISGAFAGTMTIAMGEAYLNFFLRGVFNPSTEEILAEMKRHWKTAHQEVTTLSQR